MASVEGWAAPGFGTVRELFAQGVADGLEDHAQCAAFVGGELVCDLWTKGHARGVQNVFSSTKVLTSLVVAMLVDRGYLAYDQTVASIWPEFAQHGKGGITIAQVMRHQAGLAEFSEVLLAEDLADLRSGNVARIIARQKPSHTETDPEKAPRQYHSLTRGWIVNEIVRRVDPQSRTIGELLRDEIAAPLQLGSELSIGTPRHLSPTSKEKTDAGRHEIQPLKLTSFWWTWWNLLMPRVLGGGKVPLHSFALRVALVWMMPLYKLLERWNLIKSVSNLFTLADARQESQQPAPTPGEEERANDADADPVRRRGTFGPQLTTRALWASKENIGVRDLFNTAKVMSSECPSANGHASGHALAKIASMIVCGGKLPGASSARLLSEKGVKEAHAAPVEAKMFGFPRFWFTQAGWNIFKPWWGDGGRHGFVGWFGLGGSVCMWHPGLSIGFGYAMNQMEITPTNERGLRLQREVVRCARRAAAGAAAGGAPLTTRQHMMNSNSKL